MFAEERQEKIYQIINQRNFVKVSELSGELDISEVTIRRDLEELQKQKRIVRTHGGAMAACGTGRDMGFPSFPSRETEQKRQIARLAYDMIREHDTVLLDASGTVGELVKLIANGSKKDLRVITTSLTALRLLSKTDNCSVQIVGGEVNFNSGAVEGSAACRFLRDIRVDKSFVGIHGIDENFGFSTPRYADADIKSAMLQVAHSGFVLADRTKLGKTCLARVEAPDYLITDRMEPGFAYEELGTGMTVLFAGDGTERGAR